MQVLVLPSTTMHSAVGVLEVNHRLCTAAAVPFYKFVGQNCSVQLLNKYADARVETANSISVM